MMYVIAAPEMKIMKIGVSREPLRRMKDIQVSFPTHLEIIAVIPKGGTKEERSFHRAMHEFRRQGEWFEMTDESMQLLNGLLSDHPFLDAKAFDEFNSWPSILRFPGG